MRKLAFYYDVVDDEDTINPFTSLEGRKPILYYRENYIRPEAYHGHVNLRLKTKAGIETNFTLEETDDLDVKDEVDLYWASY